MEGYNGAKMKESDSIVEHINKMIVLAKELATHGNPILDKLQVSTILRSLPDSWEPVVVPLNISNTSTSMKNLPMILGIKAQRREKKKNSELLLISGPTPSQGVSSSNSNPKKY